MRTALRPSDMPVVLRRARDERELTQEDAASWFSERLKKRGEKLTLGAYGAWERGDSLPAPHKADLIAEFLDYPILEVLPALGVLVGLPKVNGLAKQGARPNQSKAPLRTSRKPAKRAPGGTRTPKPAGYLFGSQAA